MKAKGIDRLFLPKKKKKPGGGIRESSLGKTSKVNVPLLKKKKRGKEVPTITSPKNPDKSSSKKTYSQP